jgi:hypothetical protein
MSLLRSPILPPPLLSLTFVCVLVPSVVATHYQSMSVSFPNKFTLCSDHRQQAPSRSTTCLSTLTDPWFSQYKAFEVFTKLNFNEWFFHLCQMKWRWNRLPLDVNQLDIFIFSFHEWISFPWPHHNPNFPYKLTIPMIVTAIFLTLVSNV